MLESIAREIIIIILVACFVFLLLRYLFGVRIRFETKKSARSQAELARAHQLSIRHEEQLALQKIVDAEVAKLRQHLERTIRKMDEYTRAEMQQALTEELKAHKDSATAVKEAAKQAINESTALFEQQQNHIDQLVAEKVEQVKERLAARVEEDFADILQHYVENILREALPAEDQIKSIVSQLEKDKQAIIQDLQNGN